MTDGRARPSLVDLRRLAPALALMLATACGGGSSDESSDAHAETSESDGADTTAPEEGEGEDESGSGPAPVPDNPCWSATLSAPALPRAIGEHDGELFTVSTRAIMAETSGVEGPWTPTAEFDLRSFTPETIGGAPDDLWLSDGFELVHFDGHGFEPFPLPEHVQRVEVSQDAQGVVWLFMEACQFNCDYLLWRRVGAQWEALPILAYNDMKWVAYGVDERWVSRWNWDEGIDIYRQEGEDYWQFFDHLDGPGQEVPGLHADASGLWVAGWNTCGLLGELRLARHPSAAEPSEWVEATLPVNIGDCRVRGALHQGQLYFVVPDLGSLYRWDGHSPEPEAALKLPFADRSWYPGSEVDLLARDGRLLLYDNREGHTLYEFTDEPTPQLEVIHHDAWFDLDVMVGQDLESVFGFGDTTVHEWSSSAQPQAPDDPGAWSVHHAFDFYSPQSLVSTKAGEAWLLERTSDPLVGSFSRLWHLRAGEPLDLSADFPSSHEFELLWGRGDQLWLYGRTEPGYGQYLAAWSREGDAWQVSTTPPLKLPDFIAVTGDDERRYLLDAFGDIHVHGDNEWVLLPPTELTDVHHKQGQLALVDGQLFLRAYQYAQDFPGTPELRTFMVWDGEQWRYVASRWPDAPAYASAMAADGLGGLWALAPAPPLEPEDPDDPGSEPPLGAIGEGASLHYFHSGSWQHVESPEPLGEGLLHASPEGVILQEHSLEGGHTRVFRWSCE